jgi:nucleoside-diphosphate-sugar epimerase
LDIKMTTLVVGASGATGKLVVEQLLAQGKNVKVIVRSTDTFANTIKNHSRLVITKANILELTNEQLQAQVIGCTAVVSCLGHNLSIKGIYGHPRRLVKHAVQRLCDAIEATAGINANTPVKFILMNSTGNQNIRDGEKIPLSQAIAVNIIRFLVPPHADNEDAADYLQSHYGQNNPVLEWVTVRPDALVNQPLTSVYDIYKAPTRNPIFNPGITSRINVAHFMSELITNVDLWNTWKSCMPVIYNRVS